MIPDFKTYIKESLWSDLQNKSIGKSVRKEDIITSKEELKKRINALYMEQGKGDTLDVSSLSKFITCDDFSGLFFDFYNVKQIIGLEKWDVSKVINMDYMFSDCKSLTELDLSNWDVSKVTNMNGMFSDCKSLTELDLSNWDVSKVTDMNFMFYFCRNLTELNISNWDVSNVTNLQCMFYGCNKLIKPKWYNE